MKGVSEVIAIILILMITIAIAGLAYTFMSSTMASTTSAASSAVTTTTSSMLTSFSIENVDVAKVYIRNTGQSILSNLSVYVNDEPAVYSISPSAIAAGQIGIITIYSFIPDEATVKVTSPSGFSTSKVANPCAKAVGCWKFNENSGTVAYDSSQYGNTGIMPIPSWTSGKYENGLRADGVSIHANVSFTQQLNITGPFTISAWIYPTDNRYGFILMRGANSGVFSYGMATYNTPSQSIYLWAGGISMPGLVTTGNVFALNQWSYVVGIYNGTSLSIYLNGILLDSTPSSGNLRGNSEQVVIGRYGSSYPFNGTIDEVRIYNRAIY